MSSDLPQAALPRGLAMAVCYVLTFVVGRATAPADGGPALIWPAAGISTIWLAGHARARSRGAVSAVAVIVACSLVVNCATGASEAMAAGFAIANVTMAVVSARVLGIAKIEGVWRLDCPAAFFRLLRAAVAGAVVSGVVGSAAFELVATATWLTAVQWVLRNAVSAMVTGVIWYGLVCPGTRAEPVHGHQPRPGLLLIATVADLAVWLTRDPVLLFLLLPGTMLVALRSDVRTTGWFTCGLSSAALVSTFFGYGPLSALGPSPRSVVAQAFILVMITVSTTISLDRLERRRLYAQLQAERAAGAAQTEILEQVLSSIDEGVVLVGVDGTVRMGNHAAGSLLGLDESYVGSRSLPEALFVAPPRVDEARVQSTARTDSPLQQVLSGTAAAQRDVVVRSADGTVRVVAVGAKPLVHAEGELAVGVIRDVTEERRHTEELARFAGTVAHDLRGPLTGMHCWLEVLETEYSDDQELAGIAGRLLGAADRMNTLIEDLLTYSVSRGGRIETQPLLLQSIVEEAVAAAADRVGTGPAATFECDVDGWVLADRAALSQVLGNLLGNSLKYAQDGVGASLTLTTSDAAPGLLRLTIADRGPGVPDGEEARIFEEFHRVPATAGNHTGTGLGLAICRRIIERHGGSINARNREGGGLAVDLVLPIGHPSPADTLAEVTRRQAAAAHNVTAATRTLTQRNETKQPAISPTHAS